MKEEVLSDIGFSKNESKVYLALLELGSCTAGKIADMCKVHRTNVYDALERLHEKGIVSFIMKDNNKYFEACDPESLLLSLKEKEAQLNSILPQLKLSKQLAQHKSEAHVHEGVTAFCRLLDHFLEYKDPILVYGIPPVAPEMLKTFIPHFHKRRIAKKIVMKHIYNHNAQERIKYLNTLPLTEARWLPEKYDSLVSTNICGDEVFLTLWINPPHSIQIKNKTIADAYKNFFELLWKEAQV